MSFDDVITDLVQRCPGARGAALMDPDGIPVVMEPSERVLEIIGAEFATVLRQIENAERELRYGALRQVSVYADGAHLFLTRIVNGYFLVLLVEPDEVAGKARFLSKLAGERLYPELNI